MPNIRWLIWDEWNVAHIARHNVVPHEVEAVCYGEHIEHEAYAGRMMVIGQVQSGRMLSVILAPESEQGVYYAVTARPASRRERRIYQQRRER